MESPNNNIQSKSLESETIKTTNTKNSNNSIKNNLQKKIIFKDKVVLISMVSGLFSGSLAKMITHPIDTIKARVQVETKANEKISHAFKSLIKNEGIAGLYRGIGVSVIGSMPANVLYFGTYEYCKKHLLFLNYLQGSEFLKYFISGICAETVACLIYVPVDIIKERRQVQSKLKTYNYKNDLDALFTIIKQEKLRGIYKAYGATIFSFGPMSAFYFMFYEYFKGFFVRNDAQTYIKKIKKEDLNSVDINDKNSGKQNLKKLNITFLESLLCSGLASSLSCYITTPLDLVKFRMQVQRASDNYDKKNAEYRNMLQGLIRIGYKEGIKGLFRGSCARILSFAPTGALTMTFLEVFKPKVAKALD